jgi:hypothetical protein
MLSNHTTCETVPIKMFKTWVVNGCYLGRCLQLELRRSLPTLEEGEVGRM